MTHLGLFEGIGGFSLAARWAGWETIAWCEIDKFCQKVLTYHFPKSKGHEDIKTTDFSIYRGKIDIITGGFPCQPYSTAGKRLGKNDDRHLWPEMLRAIREVRPRWVVGENVYGIVNWNGGLVFEEVQADLEAEGYEVQPYVLPACAVNAPHRRDRVWFVAFDTNNEGGGAGLGEVSKADGKISERNKDSELGNANKSNDGIDKDTNSHGWPCFERKEKSNERKFGNIGSRDNEQLSTDNDEIGIASNADNKRFKQQSGNTVTNKSGQYSGTPCTKWFENWPTQSPICGGDDGLSDRLDNLTFPKWRRESIKAYGNAIVPQVAYQIFKAINLHEEQFTIK